MPKLAQDMGVGRQVPSTNERTGRQNLVCNEKPRELRGFRAFGIKSLLDLDHWPGRSLDSRTLAQLPGEVFC